MVGISLTGYFKPKKVKEVAEIKIKREKEGYFEITAEFGKNVSWEDVLKASTYLRSLIKKTEKKYR